MQTKSITKLAQCSNAKKQQTHVVIALGHTALTQPSYNTCTNLIIK